MSDGLDLREFLQSQTSDGVVDSQGVFTVAREKALSKLALFGLPGEFHWVLKIVQAANLCQAPLLQVRQTRVATSFSFCPAKGQPFPSESAIMHALESPVLDKDHPVHQLAMALRSLVQQTNLSFVLAVRQHGELGKPIFAGDDASSLHPQTRLQWTRMDREGIRLTVSHFRGNESYTGRYIPTFSRVIKRHTLIAQMLEERCFTSAVPITLDGRLISTVFPTRHFHSDRRLRPLILGRVLPGNGEEPDGVQMDVLSGRLPKERLKVCASLDQPADWFLITGPDVHVASPIFDFFDSGMRERVQPDSVTHQLCWVRHGVLVARYTLPFRVVVPLRFSFFFSADGLRTDLSGLQAEGVANDFPSSVNALALVRTELQKRRASAHLSQALSDPAARLGPASESPQGGDLDEVGRSIFTDSLLFELPSINEGLMRVLDRTGAVVSRHILPDRALRQWIATLEQHLSPLLEDLASAHRFQRREL